MKPPRLRSPLVLVTLALVALFVAVSALRPGPEPRPLAFGDLMRLLAADRVTHVEDLTRDSRIEGRLAGGRRFEASYNPGVKGGELGRALAAARARGRLDEQRVDSQAANPLMQILFSLLPVVVILGFFFFREVRSLVDEAHDEALEVLAAYRGILEELADGLMYRQTVEKDALAAVLARVTPRPSRKIKPLADGDGSSVPGATVVNRLRRLWAPAAPAAGGIEPVGG
ncbi:MAG: hypothetical protein M3N17_04835 [Actinomycetota bacterium]|nr:hypothetical protein [Actinomycetota bacterium]